MMLTVIPDTEFFILCRFRTVYRHDSQKPRCSASANPLSAYFLETFINTYVKNKTAFYPTMRVLSSTTPNARLKILPKIWPLPYISLPSTKRSNKRAA